jgi:hypothetical protein
MSRTRQATWTHYRPGDVVGNTRVIQLTIAARQQERSFYEVETCCCGTRATYNHSWLARRAAQMDKAGGTPMQCAACKDTKPKIRIPPDERSGARDATGVLWPRLTRLAPRWAA